MAALWKQDKTKNMSPSVKLCSSYVLKQGENDNLNFKTRRNYTTLIQAHKLCLGRGGGTQFVISQPNILWQAFIKRQLSQYAFLSQSLPFR